MDLFGAIDVIQGIMFLVLFMIVIAIAGVAVFIYASNLHPKHTFVVFSPNGMFVRKYRLYANKFPTRNNLIEILLGMKNIGFPITLFSTIYFNGQPAYLAQYVERRLFPLPMADRLGFVDVYIRKCPKCKYVQTREDDDGKCPDCHCKLEYSLEKMKAEDLHALKFNPEIEKRAIYKADIDGTKIPLAEWIQMYDIGQKIAEEMDRSENDAKNIAEKHNPFITAIIATLPFGIILAGTALIFYLMFLGIGGEMKTASEQLVRAAEILKELKKA